VVPTAVTAGAHTAERRRNSRTIEGRPTGRPLSWSRDRARSRNRRSDRPIRRAKR
jgi:hypothetical protein